MQNQLLLGRTRFPALGAGYEYFCFGFGFTTPAPCKFYHERFPEVSKMKSARARGREKFRVNRGVDFLATDVMHKALFGPLIWTSNGP